MTLLKVPDSTLVQYFVNVSKDTSEVGLLQNLCHAPVLHCESNLTLSLLTVSTGPSAVVVRRHDRHRATGPHPCLRGPQPRVGNLYHATEPPGQVAPCPPTPPTPLHCPTFQPPSPASELSGPAHTHTHTLCCSSG